MDIKWKASPEVLHSKIDDEAVLMSIEAGFYFSLDPVGSRIWEMLSKEPASFDELVAKLMEEYGVDEDTCRADVEAFLEEMKSRKLVRQAD